MYQIRTETGEKILTEKVMYIRAHSSGVYLLTDAGRAEGIVYQGTAHLFAEGTTVQEVNAGEQIRAADEMSGIVFVTLAESGSVDGATAAEHAAAFSPWVFPAEYSTGNLRRHDGVLYRCLQDHTSEETWTPDAAPSLWVKVADPAEEWPAWSQPIGSADAYERGAKVSHKGKRYISDVDANVWEPSVYGWTEQSA